MIFRKFTNPSDVTSDIFIYQTQIMLLVVINLTTNFVEENTWNSNLSKDYKH